MFSPRIKQILIGGLVLVAFFWLVEFLTPDFSVSNILRTSGLSLFRTPITGILRIYQGISQIKNLSQLLNVQRENFALKEEILKIRQEKEDLERKSTVCSKWQDVEEFFPTLETKPAEIRGYFQEGGRSYLMINRGKKQGVLQDKAVVWGEYLVGKITEVYANESIVETILSQNIVANVYIANKPEAKGVVQGYLGSGMKLEGVPTEFEVKENETILTSGLGGILPPHLIVGKTLKRTSSASEVSQRFLVEPLIDFQDLEVVFVVIN